MVSVGLIIMEASIVASRKERERERERERACKHICASELFSFFSFYPPRPQA
jgi:hypothetical protein